MARTQEERIAKYESIITQIDDAMDLIGESGGVVEYKIGDRELRRYDAGDLIKLREYYVSIMTTEDPDSQVGGAGWETHVVKLS